MSKGQAEPCGEIGGGGGGGVGGCGGEEIQFEFMQRAVEMDMLSHGALGLGTEGPAC